MMAWTFHNILTLHYNHDFDIHMSEILTAQQNLYSYSIRSHYCYVSMAKKCINEICSYNIAKFIFFSPDSTFCANGCSVACNYRQVASQTLHKSSGSPDLFGQSRIIIIIFYPLLQVPTVSHYYNYWLKSIAVICSQLLVASQLEGQEISTLAVHCTVQLYVVRGVN